MRPVGMMVGMLFRRSGALAIALSCALSPACAFDRSGSTVSTGTDADPAGSPDSGSDATDAAPDSVDASPCADSDGDGYFAPTMPGAVCDPVDCDDDDDRVHPGQMGSFTTPKSTGDFDYDCDGVETKLADTRLGEGCHADLFGPCEGTGWVGAVPECGEPGTWHRCESGLFSCGESESVDGVMPCR